MTIKNCKYCTVLRDPQQPLKNQKIVNLKIVNNGSHLGFAQSLQHLVAEVLEATF
jgi:hypothetical protein